MDPRQGQLGDAMLTGNRSLLPWLRVVALTAVVAALGSCLAEELDPAEQWDAFYRQSDTANADVGKADAPLDTPSEDREVGEGKKNGESCDSDEECESNNCRQTPVGDRQCVIAGSACADGGGGGLGVGQSVCVVGDQDLYVCTDEDAFEQEDCTRDCAPYGSVHGCADGKCSPCPTSCLDDTACQPEAHCNSNNVCVADEVLGEVCDRDGMCESGNCRAGPGATSFCSPDGADCAAGGGAGLGAGEAVCQEGTSLSCTARDVLEVENCSKQCGSFPDVSVCNEQGRCEPCPSSCSCDDECKAVGHCELPTSTCVADLPEGMQCERAGMCQSGNCRKAPDNSLQCVPEGAACADGAGGALAAGESSCHEGDSYSCTGEDTFASKDCQRDCGFYPDVDSCDDTTGQCPACGDSCSSDADCKAGVAVCSATSSSCVASGETCTSDADCPTGVCRAAPDGTQRCAPEGSACSDGSGETGLTAGQSVCFGGDAYTCSSAYTFTSEDCTRDCGHFQDVDSCDALTGHCQPCLSTCASDADCKPSAHCGGSSDCIADLGLMHVCERDGMCESNNCRKAPDGTYHCVTATGQCSDTSGNFLVAGQKTCFGGDSWTCQGEDTLTSQDCANDCGYYPAVDSCEATTGQCEACAESCASHTKCDDNAYCDATHHCVQDEPNGQPCTENAMCDSDNCRKDPDGQEYCTPSGKLCSDGSGDGFVQDQGVCQGDDLLSCTAQDIFTPVACPTDCGNYQELGCQTDHCEPCPTSCSGDAECKTSSCRKSPDNVYRCVASLAYPPASCSDVAGGAMSVGDATCHNNRIYICESLNTFTVAPCLGDQECVDGQCKCVQGPTEDVCDPARSSDCDANTCVCDGWEDECPSPMTCERYVTTGTFECFCGGHEGDRCEEMYSNTCANGNCACTGNEVPCQGDLLCFKGGCRCNEKLDCDPTPDDDCTCNPTASDGCIEIDLDPTDPYILLEWVCACGGHHACPRPIGVDPLTYMTCDAHTGICSCPGRSCNVAEDGVSWRADRCIGGKCVCGPTTPGKECSETQRCEHGGCYPPE